MILTPAQIRSIIILTVEGRLEERDEFVRGLRERYEDSQKYIQRKQIQKTK